MDAWDSEGFSPGAVTVSVAIDRTPAHMGIGGGRGDSGWSDDPADAAEREEKEAGGAAGGGGGERAVSMVAFARSTSSVQRDLMPQVLAIVEGDQAMAESVVGFMGGLPVDTLEGLLKDAGQLKASTTTLRARLLTEAEGRLRLVSEGRGDSSALAGRLSAFACSGRIGEGEGSIKIGKAVARAALNECGQNIPNAEENVRVRYSLCQDVYQDLKTILGARSPFVLDTIAAFLNDETITVIHLQKMRASVDCLKERALTTLLAIQAAGEHTGIPAGKLRAAITAVGGDSSVVGVGGDGGGDGGGGGVGGGPGTTAADGKKKTKATYSEALETKVEAGVIGGGGGGVGGGGGGGGSERPSFTPDGEEDDLTKSTWHRGKDGRGKSTAWHPLCLKSDIETGLNKKGWEQPTFVQQLALSPLLNGYSAIIQAQSGLGKTGSYVIPLLQRINLRAPTKNGLVQAVILATSKELVDQIYKEVKSLYAGRGLKVLLCMGGRADQGGTDVVNDVRQIQEGVHVVVGSVGRVASLMKPKQATSANGQARMRTPAIKPDNITMVALDEVDMLFEFKGAPGGLNSNNMCADTEGIVKYACNGTQRPFQLVFVSATMPDAALKKMGEVYWQQPKIKAAVKREGPNHKGLIRIEHEGSGRLLAGIKNFHVQTDNTMVQEFGGVWEAKFAVLYDLYNELGLSRGGCQTIVFCESQVQVTHIYDEMRTRKRGNVTTQLKAFRQGKKGMLITTRVLNRGIDIPNVQLVVNFSLANLTAENFIHGVGRCGRHGKVGAALTILGPDGKETGHFNTIEREYSFESDGCSIGFSELKGSGISLPARAEGGAGGGGGGGGGGRGDFEPAPIPDANAWTESSCSVGTAPPAGDGSSIWEQVMNMEKRLMAAQEKIATLEEENRVLGQENHELKYPNALGGRGGGGGGEGKKE